MFNVFDEEVGKGVTSSLMKKLDEELPSPSLNGPYEFSTKEQSEGSAPLKDIGLKLHQNIFNIEEEKQPVIIQIILQVDQANEPTFKEHLDISPTILQPLVDLIKSKTRLAKDEIMNEFREEVRKEEEEKFEERMRKFLAFEKINIMNEIEERYPQLKKS